MSDRMVTIAHTDVYIHLMTRDINIIVDVREACCARNTTENPISVEKMTEYMMWNEVLTKYENARYNLMMAKEALIEKQDDV